MAFTQILFYVFAIMMLVSALCVITARNPVHAALCLVLTFLCTSVLWLLLDAEFLAIALVLIYVGAVMVLFLFVIMMLDVNHAAKRGGFVRYAPIATLIALAIFTQLILVFSPNLFLIGPGRFGSAQYNYPATAPADYSNTQALGQAIFTDYLYPFEIAGVILLVAIIAAISLTLRKRSQSKRQNPGDQIQVQKQDRLRIVKMEAEK